MPLILEVLEGSTWKYIGQVGPASLPVSLSDNNQDERTIYIAACSEDDSKSTLYRSKNGADIGLGIPRHVVSGGLEKVRELGDKESCEFDITDVGPQPRRIKLSHVRLGRINDIIYFG